MVQVRVWRFDLTQAADAQFEQVADFSCATLPEGLCVNKTHVALLSQGDTWLEHLYWLPGSTIPTPFACLGHSFGLIWNVVTNFCDADPGWIQPTAFKSHQSKLASGLLQTRQQS